MTTDNLTNRPDKRMLLFALIYNIITLAFIFGLNFYQKYFYAYLLGFIVLWVVGAIVLTLLFTAGKMRLKSTPEKLLLLLSTPIPIFLFLAYWMFFAK